MRTTIKIDDDLLREAKRIAAERDSTLTEVIEDSLREMLARRKRATERERVVLPTSGEGGLRPGVNLDNSAELLDIMEAEDDHPGR